MEVLKKLYSDQKSNLYELVDPANAQNKRIHIFLADTPETNNLCADSCRVSPQFERSLSSGINRIIASTSLRESIPSDVNADVLYILRDGLNFNPTDGLNRLGINATKHYVSSQRKENESGIWEICQDEYSKLFSGEKRGRDVNLFFGDIVATGTSLKNGLGKMAEAMLEKGSSFNSIYFFTIGCSKTEEVFEEFLMDKKYGLVFEKCEINIIYLEGRFGLANEKTPILIKTPGTDLLTYHEKAVLTPELMSKLLARPEQLLERCVIYDGGKRANDWQGHLRELLDYWGKLMQRGFDTEMTCLEAVNERFPILGSDFMDLIPEWAFIDPNVKRILNTRKNSFFRGDKNTNKYLIKVCEDKIDSCRALLGGRK